MSIMKAYRANTNKQKQEEQKMKNRWNRPNEYIETETGTLCKVYNYNMDTIKEMEAQGWTLRGTYICFFSFWKEK